MSSQASWARNVRPPIPANPAIEMPKVLRHDDQASEEVQKAQRQEKRLINAVGSRIPRLSQLSTGQSASDRVARRRQA
jgi:hypothetical protein